MSSEPLAKLAEEFFQASLDSSPTSAIMRGHKKYFDQIEELTDEKFEEEMENVQNFKNSLSNIDLNSLSDKEKVTYGMLEFALDSNYDSLVDRGWEFSAGVAGFEGFLIDYNQQMFIPDKESGDMLLKRLELYEKFYSQISDVQKRGLENNRVATQRNLKRSIDQLESYLKTSLDSCLLYTSDAADE